jgi:PKD repeat protein
MKKILWLIVLIPFLAMSQTNVYIDPSLLVNGDGSIDEPYNTWASCDPVLSNHNYYQKRGTRTTYNPPYGNGISIENVENVLIYAYGSGDPPVIDAGGANRIFDISNSTDITIKGYNLIRNNDNNQNNVVGQINFNIKTGQNIDNILIDSCYIVGNYCGIRVAPYGVGTFGRLIIRRTNICNSLTDGIFVRANPDSYLEYFMVDSCEVFNVNLEAYKNINENSSHGDCIHLVHVKEAYILNSILNHSSTTNKFCYIHTLSVGGISSLINCSLYPPKDTTHWCAPCGEAGGAVAFYIGLAEATIDHCLISCRGCQEEGCEGTTAAFLSESENFKLLYSVIDSTGEMYVHPSYPQNIEVYNNSIISTSDKNEYLFSYSGNITGNFKNNVVLTPIGVTPVIGTGSHIDVSNNITSSSDPLTWDATYYFNGSQDGKYNITDDASPLYNTGTDTYEGITEDFIGTTIPQNGLYDIGAYEYFEDILNDPPVVPTGLYVSNITPTSVILNWDLGTDVNYYRMSVWDADWNPVAPYIYYNIGYVSSLDLTGLTPLGSGNTGWYYWWIRAVNDYGVTNSDTIKFCTIQELPVADFEVDDQTINPDDIATFTNLSTCEICSYEWVFEGGMPNELKTFNIDETPEIEYPYVGTYDVILTAINESGEDVEIKEGYIIVTNEITAPVPAFHSDKQSVRIGQSIHFINETVESGTMTYLWNFGGDEGVEYIYLGNTDESSKNPIIKYLIAGTYDVELISENEAGSNKVEIGNYLTILPGLLKRFLYFLR